MRDINDICLATADIYLENDDTSFWWWYGLWPRLCHSGQISCLVGFRPPEWNVMTGCGRCVWQRRLIRCMTKVPRLTQYIYALCYYNRAIARVRDEIESYFSRLYNLWLTNEHEIPSPPPAPISPPAPPPPPDDPQRTSVFNPTLILAQHIQTTRIHSKKNIYISGQSTYIRGGIRVASIL